MKKAIAIIGAGISGLILANKLKSYAEVCVFEKARGVGGRMSTRYAGDYAFDHGTQCFTARCDAFKAFLQPYIASNLITPWHGKVINLEKNKPISIRKWDEEHLVASPNMNSLCKELAKGINIKLSSEVAALSDMQQNKWQLFDVNNEFLGEYDFVISTAPPAQTIKLFQKHLPDNTPLQQSKMQGCYALMIGMQSPWQHDWIGAKVINSPIKWISINSTKPLRNNSSTSIVVHSRGNWADNHINDEIQAVERILLDEFKLLTNLDVQNAQYISTHRWRYAIVKATKKLGFHFDSSKMLAATSDWCATSRIEEIFINADNLSKLMIKESLI